MDVLAIASVVAVSTASLFVGMVIGFVFAVMIGKVTKGIRNRMGR
jgi:hypothetical protein